MTIQGEQIVGHTVAKGANGEVFGIEAATGARLDPAFGGATKDDLERACALAAEAFPIFAGFSPERRAGFLEAIAEEIAELGDALIERCCQESGLPRPRVEGERGRTMGQLRLFAAVLRDGGYLDARIDPALPDRKPLPRPDLRLRNVPVGPVAVFGASNFPLAFSVAGGDTASALAAGCPVVAKAHSAHPGTSELVARAVLKAAQRTGMPEGVFSLLFDSGREIGQGLVADRRIKAVGFTGSRTGGTALMRIAAGRPEPIPVYAEMSSINPVLLFPAALEARGDAIAKGFAASLTLGAGQFCTNPGLVLAIDGEALDRFTAAAAEALAQMPAAVMLTPGIHKAYEAGVAQLEGHASVQTVARGQDGGSLRGQAGLFSVSAADFLAHHELQDEVFGAASLVVRCRDEGELREVVDALEGQLTVALHIDEADHDAARALLPALETKAGRILVNGFGTGVEVAHAMVHGGPYPATADGRTTSVGSKAIERFLRPVCYQDLPAALLPDALQDGNPLGLWRREDGRMTAPRA